MSFRQSAEELYCHDPACRLYNRPQEFRYYPASWDGPAEWIEDPECRACFGPVEPEPQDVLEFVELALEELPEDVDDWYEADREIVCAVARYREARAGMVREANA